MTCGSSIVMLLNAKRSILVKPHTVTETTTLMGSYWTQLIVTKTWASYLINGLKFHQHASETAMKAWVLACIRRGFINLNESVLLQIYKSIWFDLYTRIWKLIWGPHYVLHKRQLKGVQWHATKLVPSLRDESYIDRLTSLNLPSLLYRLDVVTYYFFSYC